MFRGSAVASGEWVRARHGLLTALFLGHVMLSGCQTPEGSVAGGSKRVDERTSLQTTVVGRFEVYEDGAPVEMGWFSKVESVSFIAAPRGTDRGTLLGVHGDGSLRWSLSPGEYDLVAVRLQRRSGFGVIPMDGRLAVTAGGGAVNIGTLIAETGRFGARLRQVEPSGETTALQLRSRTVGAFAAVVDVCATRWWLQCTSRIKGVTPVEPPVAIELSGPQLARVSSLQPRFSWQGSAGASYDFAVWRAVEYQVATFSRREYVPGQLVHYAEGLDKAELTDIPPLQPRTRYYWSVRMRQGDTVSSWSTAGHSTFLLVAWSSSSGRLFEFETP